jgi:hypothetical protein
LTIERDPRDCYWKCVLIERDARYLWTGESKVFADLLCDDDPPYALSGLGLVLFDPADVAEKLPDNPVIALRHFQLYDYVVTGLIDGEYVDVASAGRKLDPGDALICVKLQGWMTWRLRAR